MKFRSTCLNVDVQFHAKAGMYALSNDVRTKNLFVDVKNVDPSFSIVLRQFAN